MTFHPFVFNTTRKLYSPMVTRFLTRCTFGSHGHGLRRWCIDTTVSPVTLNQRKTYSSKTRVSMNTTKDTSPAERVDKSLSNPPPLYMDTHKMVQELAKAGYSQSQAEALVALLTSSLQSSVLTLVTEHVKRHELDLLELKLKGELESVRSNVILIERSVVDSLRKDNESLRNQIGKLNNGFKEEVGKVQAGLRLDLNLEKSRIKEEGTGLQQLIKDTNNTIEKEVAQLKTQIESQKLESIKYLAGGIFSIVTIMLSVVLGLWRLMAK